MAAFTQGIYVIVQCRDCGDDREATVYWKTVYEGEQGMLKCPTCHAATSHIVVRVGVLR